MDVNNRGEAYVMNRSSWTSPYAGPYGVGVYDVAADCTLLSAGIVDVGMEPYTITFL